MSRLRARAAVWAICGLLSAFGLAAWGGAAPVVADVYVTVVENAPQSFRVVASDEDIDPMSPENHPIRFVLADGPFHGALRGLADVGYGPLREAWVDITYVPALGYVGADSITLVAVDAAGGSSQLATVRIDIVGGEDEGVLAGTWDAEFTFDVQTPAITAFAQRITEVYRIGGLTLKGIAEFGLESPSGTPEVVFDALRFEGDFSLGDLAIDATLAFDPEAESVLTLFDYFTSNEQLRLFGLSLAHSLYLTYPQTGSYQVVAVGGTAGELGFADSLRLDLDEECTFDFARNDAYVTWSWCETQFRATLSLTCAGFEDLTLAAYGIPLPSFGWLPGGATLDASFGFEVDTKSLSLSFDWRPLSRACLYVLGELVVGGATDTTIEEVSLYGLVLECEVSEGVTLKSATSLDAAKNAALTGQVDYFESLVLTGELSSCCGVPGSFSVATYFAHDSQQLFDWGMTLLKADVAISEHFSARLDVALRSGEFGDPRAEFTIGWTARW